MPTLLRDVLGWWLTRRAAIRLGQPTGYKIMPGGDLVRPFAHEGASILRRAGFIRHNLWVTAYDPTQRYAAGDYINQNPAPEGLDQWIKRDSSLENTDIVAWYSSVCIIFRVRKTGR